MRRLLTWLVVFLVVAGAISAAAYPMKTWWEQRNAPKYLTATISRGPVETVVNSTGTIKPVRTVSVGAFTSGPIKEIKVDFNSEIAQTEDGKWEVQTGPVKEVVEYLALIDDKLQTAAVKRDNAAVLSAKAELERVTKLLEHAVRKKGRGDELLNITPKPRFPYISESELDELEFGVKTLVAQKKLAAASVEQAEAGLKNSEEQLGYTKILPPKEIDRVKGVRGKVVDRKVDPGQTVVGTFQTAEMFTIALEMDKHVHVYASVDEADIGEIKNASDRNQAVSFTVDAHPGELFEGSIYDIRLNSTTTQNVVTYPVIIDAKKNVQKLKPGMTANITFQINKTELEVPRVPVAALRFTPQKDQVRPEDKYRLEALTMIPQNVPSVKRTADEKAKIAGRRAERIVWVQDGKLLRAVPITIGLNDHQYAQIVKGELQEGDTVVTGLEGNLLPR